VSQIYIYCLKDPRDLSVRYVGKTVDLERRYCDHMRNNDPNKAKRDWIQELKRAGKEPIMSVLELCNPEDWPEREKFWISYGIKAGWGLTNIASGGGKRGERYERDTPEGITDLFCNFVGMPFSERQQFFAKSWEERFSHILDGLQEMDEYLTDVARRRFGTNT